MFLYFYSLRINKEKEKYAWITNNFVLRSSENLFASCESVLTDWFDLFFGRGLVAFVDDFGKGVLMGLFLKLLFFPLQKLVVFL